MRPDETELQSLYNPFYYTASDPVTRTAMTTGDKWQGTLEQRVAANKFPFAQQGYDDEETPTVLPRASPVFPSNKYDQVNITTRSFAGNNEKMWLRLCDQFFPLKSNEDDRDNFNFW